MQLREEQSIQNTAKQNYPGLVGQETKLVYLTASSVWDKYHV